jgi:hypothetical protein
MILQCYPSEWKWVNATLDSRPGGFLRAFCDACLQADQHNYELLCPVVAKLMEKYPSSARQRIVGSPPAPFPPPDEAA